VEHRSLLLLGLLMGQSQHGYQINDFIEKNLSAVTDMKKPTAYATLDKLNQKGYIDIHFEQEGNRPVRKVYTINEKGRNYFFQLLRENLSSPRQVNDEGDIGLMFTDFLPPEETVAALRERLRKNKGLMKLFQQTPSHGKRSGVNLVVEHKIAMLKAEIAFLEKTIERLVQAD
jgi:transcriptional regulator, PadR family